MAPIHVVYATLATLLLTRLSRHANAQAPNPQQDCLIAAQTAMKDCAEAGSISVPNFLWFVTNGTSSNGQAPTDAAAFKDQICQAEPEVGGCIFTQMVGLVNGTACSQAPQVLQNVQTLLLTYDNKCANPCRFTLVDDLRACYTQVGLDTGLFLNNRTAGHIIGGTDAEVTDFCSKKNALLSCMKPIHDSCPESLPILSSLNFHLPSYEKGVNVLCQQPKVYLTGLQCFVEPTDPVQKCVQESQQTFLQANVEAQAKNWTQERYIQETCSVTIKQALCDLKAWGKKNHEACNTDTIGLRQKLECILMPLNCTITQKQLFDEACDPNSLKPVLGGDSSSGGGAGGNSGMVSLPGALLLAAFVTILFPIMIQI